MLPRWVLAFLPVSLTFSTVAQAQRVSPYDTHVRVYAIVERVGAGTPDDPYRPKHLPNPKAKNGPGIKALAWTGVLSADQTHYLIEVVAAKRAFLMPLLNDPAVRWWDKAVTPRATVEAELKRLQPAASLERVRVRAR